ncbi:hypothetical protein K461DRAFT_309549 [Myriangium duriaei CBS 260.36]|uniref:Biogenesis of lysosome-related organelles complex 1 subunit KXD1 n=1 Tax=Myriangium duriaei CBS 260.36 TaxID=1168546 RepID=A0A9P4JB67_9PEZI|nr:hypothetical protein K461DRAFT_309549 [Myriangium duriaei CBS 260.36]
MPLTYYVHNMAPSHRTKPTPPPSSYTTFYPYQQSRRFSPDRTDSSATGATFSTTPSSSASSISSHRASPNIDQLEQMTGRLSYAANPISLDRTLAHHATTSGHLNAQTRELLELQALAQRRLVAARSNFADGLRAARDVQRELRWAQDRVSALNQRAAAKYPAQYQVAVAKNPPLIDD